MIKILATLVAQRFALWALDEEVSGSIPDSRINMENHILLIGLGLDVLGSALDWIPLLWHS